MTPYSLGIMVRIALMEPEQKVFQRSVETLIKQNAETLSDASKAFIHDGTIYKLNSMKGLTRGAPPLDVSLIKEMEENKVILHNCKREVQTIWQALLPLVEAHGPANGLPDQLQAIMPEKFGPRTIPFEDLLPRTGGTVRKNWASVQDLLNYFISLRLVI